MKERRIAAARAALILSGAMLAALPACSPTAEVTEPPTAVAVTVVVTATNTPAPEIVVVSPTTGPTVAPPVTATPLPTSTEEPATATPVPTETPTPLPTVPPAPTQPPAPTAPPAPPTLSPNPTFGANLLPNPSFEEGHYNQNGIPDLQVPNKWRMEWDTGNTGFGSAAWDVYVQPETRVMSTANLPPAEHPLYIADGSSTLKLYKDGGALNARLVTDVQLEPGTYVLEVTFYTDIFEKFENNAKVPPGDPNAAEIRLLVTDAGTGWLSHPYLQKSTYTTQFSLTEAKKVTVGVGVRGRYAIANNGWFIDNLKLRKAQ